MPPLLAILAYLAVLIVVALILLGVCGLVARRALDWEAAGDDERGDDPAGERADGLAGRDARPSRPGGDPFFHEADNG